MTPPVFLRATHPRDAAALTAMANKPGFRRGTLRMPFESHAFAEKRIADTPAHFTSIVAEVEGLVVGQGALMPRQRARIDHIGDIALGIDDDWTGRGIGSMILAALIDVADNWRGLKRLELSVFVDNERAIGLYQKYGFEVEGRALKAALVDGVYVDHFMMARLRF